MIDATVDAVSADTREQDTNLRAREHECVCVCGVRGCAWPKCHQSIDQPGRRWMDQMAERV